ncbi:MAG: molybdenum ABC transporter ATP-binding protein [Deltaproteobacteria bacterium]|nr:molybdenum ABC transporter ATP-binding protein [Deltaproteobacteria bacterium]
MLNIDIQKRRGNFTVRIQHVFSNSCVGIVGPSGSGKSTLLHIIAGLISPDEGSIQLQKKILFDSKTHITPQQRHIGYVRQEPLLFPHMSVLQNLLFAQKNTQNNSPLWSLSKVIEMFSLHSIQDRIPSSLSGGEKQKVALARAIIASPQLLLLDEPMASLDDSTADTFLEHLITIKAYIPMLYVSHNTQRIRYLCDNILYMNNGILVPSSEKKI